MANTVNDVMNVIASPDWGIRNIAGTNQEILAILGGVHNSKNNIHSIVNDIKSILQTLAEESTKKKPIVVGDKTPRVTPKHIQAIVDETKNINMAIVSLAKAIEKQSGKSAMPAVAKLSDKASQKVADAMIKDIEKQKGGGGMAALVDAFTKLKDISIKDLIFGNQKIKLIGKIFKNAKEDLNIKEKDLNNIIKLINSAPEMISSLAKIGRKLNKIIKNNIIGKLSDVLVGKNSVLTIAKTLQKNKNTFDKASGAAKSIKELATALSKSMRKIVWAAIWSHLAILGISAIDIMLNNLSALAKKLSKNKKEFDAGAKAAKNITVFIGNLLITSIFLTASIITVLPAILGALLLRVMVAVVLPLAKQLSRNNKHISKATGSALIFTAFTGLMLISSLFLAKVAEHAMEALLGAVVVLGVVALNLITFKILQKATKEVLIGSLVMILMSVSLLLFGIALGKITAATKGVKLKQIGIIVAMTVLLTGAVIVLGIPQVAALAALGSVVMLLMSVSLLVFGIALGKLSKATENMKFKQVLLVSGSILALGLPVAGMGALAPAILLGSVALVILSVALIPFLLVISQLHKATENLKFKQVALVAGSMMTLALPVTGLGLLSPVIVLGSVALGALSIGLLPFLLMLSQLHKATENLKFKQIGLVAGAMGTLGLAVSGMALLSIPVGMGSVTLGVMSATLLVFVKSLKMMNDMGKIPMKQVNDTIKAMKKIGNFFKKNALKPRVVRSARQYKKILIPFGSAAKHLVRLSKIKGGIPMELVQGALNSMLVIGAFYLQNPISKDTIKAARLYKRMLNPFGTTVKRLDKLKSMGTVPMDLVNQTLEAMRTIATYYTENPIDKPTIKQARKYKRMMRPFGKTLEYLEKLTKMGSVPIGLVNQTLEAMRIIATYYGENPIDRATIKQARKYKRMMRPFGKTLGYLEKLKKMGSIPIDLVNDTLGAMQTIATYYVEHPIERATIRQARKYKRMMKPFGKTLGYLIKLKKMGSIPMKAVGQTLAAMKLIAKFFKKNTVERKAIRASKKFKKLMSPFSSTVDSINKLQELKALPVDAIKDVLTTMKKIVKFFNTTFIFGDTEKKSGLIEKAVISFTNMAKNVQDRFEGIKEIDAKAVRSITSAMKSIIKFYNKSKPKKNIKAISKIIKSAIIRFTITAKLVQNMFEEMTEIKPKLIIGIIFAMKSIVKFYNKSKVKDNVLEKAELIEQAISKFGDAAKILQDKFSGMEEVDKKAIKSSIKACKEILKYYNRVKFIPKEEKIEKMNNATKLFADNAEYVRKAISKFGKKDIEKAQFAITAMKQVLKLLSKNMLNNKQVSRAGKNIKLLKNMSSALSKISTIDKSSLSDIGDALTTALGGVSSINMDQVQAVTNMFNAFKGINKSENILNKFTETVNKFTEACENLMAAMENNTDAIVGMDASSKNDSDNSGSFFDGLKSKMSGLLGMEEKEDKYQPKGVFISNVDELAKSIAQRINGVISVDVPDTQVQLTINGSDGNEWIISRY